MSNHLTVVMNIRYKPSSYAVCLELQLHLVLLLTSASLTSDECLTDCGSCCFLRYNVNMVLDSHAHRDCVLKCVQHENPGETLLHECGEVDRDCFRCCGQRFGDRGYTRHPVYKPCVEDCSKRVYENNKKQHECGLFNTECKECCWTRHRHRGNAGLDDYNYCLRECVRRQAAVRYLY